MPSERFTHHEVEGLRVGRFNLGISTSCIVYRIGQTVIDTGPPNQWRLVHDFLRERFVRRVLITHHHEDHSGNGARVQETLAAEVLAPAEGLALLREGFRLRPYQRVIWGVPERFAAEVMPPEVGNREEESSLRLRALGAPGHSPDMTCFLAPERGWLFTGDLYIASKPRFLRADENIHAQITSLEQVLQHEFNVVFCAHRGVVPAGREALRAKLDYLVSLREEVRAMRDAGRSVGAIRRALLGRESFMSFVTLFNFSKRNLVKACLAAS